MSDLTHRTLTWSELMNLLNRHLISMWRHYALARRVLTNIPDFSDVRAQYYHDYWSAAAQQLNASLTDLGEGVFRITKGNRSTLVQYHQLNIDTYLNLIIVGEKPFVHNMLHDNGYRVPRYSHYELSDLERARSFGR